MKEESEEVYKERAADLAAVRERVRQKKQVGQSPICFMFLVSRLVQCVTLLNLPPFFKRFSLHHHPAHHPRTTRNTMNNFQSGGVVF